MIGVKRIKLSLIFITLSLSLYAQDSLYIESYDWDMQPELTNFKGSLAKKNQVILKDYRIIEYVYNEEGELERHFSYHKKTKVQSDVAIEQNNRIYLPITESQSLSEVKARVIQPSGEVLSLEEEDIKEARDEETGRTYKYFALQGVTLNSEIEYLYKMQTGLSYYGSMASLQSEEMKLNVGFELISPENLIFKVKAYNGFPEFRKEFLSEDSSQVRQYAVADTIKELVPEQFANYETNLKSVCYYLEKNTNSFPGIVTSYDVAANIIYERIYGIEDKKEEKAVKKWLRKQKIPKKNTFKAIRVVEDYAKSNFAVVDEVAEEEQEYPSFLIENKYSSEVGIVRFYSEAFKQLDIEHQIVLTSDRFTYKMDTAMESFHTLNEYLIYFPDLDKYMYPKGAMSRLGYPPAEYTYNFGLFITPIQIGDFKSGMSSTKFIEPRDAEATMDIMKIKVNFNEDLLKPRMDLYREQTGYYSMNVQPAFDFIDDSRKPEVSKMLLSYLTGDADPENIKVENTGGEAFGVEPFIMKTEYDGASFISKAGPKYLLKVGELIGRQAELYSENKRQLPVENNHNRYYHRTITVEIPEGYTASNLSSAELNILHTDSAGDTTMAFISTAEIQDGELLIDVKEYYRQIEYPVSHYPAFQKVINAAADFNKAVVVLSEE